MQTILLKENQFTIVADLLRQDAEKLAEDLNFFQENDLDPKEYIDERIHLCSVFKIDFWHAVSLNSHDFFSKRLKAIYDGIAIQDFENSYKSLSQEELAKDFLKALFKR
jgi:hypothetical protein